MVAFILIACGESEELLPKPRIYPKIDFPAKEYESFRFTDCNMSFKKPKYAEIRRDEYFFGEKPVDPCWFDLQIDSLNATIHCSYLPLEGVEDFDEFVQDAFEIAYKHNIKANYRREVLIDKPNGISGIVFEIDGPVASPVQFYLTDSIDHFFRASLYFNSQVNPDSTAPVLNFLYDDIKKMVETFEW